MIFTTWVSGRTAVAKIWMGMGRMLRGKKVPEKRNMGVTKRNVGRFRVSIFGVRAVKHIPMEAKRNPASKAKGMITKEMGRSTTPKARPRARSASP